MSQPAESPRAVAPVERARAGGARRRAPRGAARGRSRRRAVRARPRARVEPPALGRRGRGPPRARPHRGRAGPARARPLRRARRELRHRPRGGRPAGGRWRRWGSTVRSWPGSPGEATSCSSSAGGTRARSAASSCVDGGVIELADWFPLVGGVPRRAHPAPSRPPHAPPSWRPGSGRGAPSCPSERSPPRCDCFRVRADGRVEPRLARHRHLQIVRSLWEHRPSTRYPTLEVPTLLVLAELGRGGRAPRRSGGPRRWPCADGAAAPLALVRARPSRRALAVPGPGGRVARRQRARGFFA